MTLMNTPADRELNKRLIDISKALTTLLCGASTVDDSAYIRDEALRTVADVGGAGSAEALARRLGKVAPNGRRPTPLHGRRPS